MGSTLAPMGANLELTSIEEGGNKEELLPLKVPIHLKMLPFDNRSNKSYIFNFVSSSVS